MTRRDALADEIGSANVPLVEQAYRDGWRDALDTVRRALRGEGRTVPTASEASARWLDEKSTIVGRRELLRGTDEPPATVGVVLPGGEPS